MIKSLKEHSHTLIVIFLALFLLAAPIIFAWHVEIGWKPKPGVILTNGWILIEVLKVYHIQLYSLVIINSLASAYILYGLVENAKKKHKQGKEEKK